MAFIVVDPDESSYLGEPSYLDREPAGGGGGAHHHFFLAPHNVAGAGHQAAAKRNLCDDFENDSSGSNSLVLPVPTAKETIQVYLRVKPKTLEESEISAASSASSVAPVDSTAAGGGDGHEEDPDCTAVVGETADEGKLLQIESEHQVAMNAPKDSNTYKNSMNGAGQLVHRFAFSRIFPPDTTQADFFRQMVLPRMRDLMEGQNQLLFTYGATSSGKTYTIQGPQNDPGILPRSLDVIFNSIGDRQMTELKLKPNCFNRVVQMKDKDVRKLEEDKQTVFSLGIELAAAHAADKKHQHADHKISGISKLSEETFANADVTNLSAGDLTAMFPELSDRRRESSAVESLKHDDILYAVWISFAEVYNENIYDLLERIPVAKRKGDPKPRRNPLKLAEDKNGSIYVKGLKEVKVNSADEAYQVMMIGRKNLHFAATRLNHQSSRSHCIFTIKVIRVAEAAKPHLARVSMLSFCDLAGAERIKKTLNTGERQKEAGNINTSLLVLGRCMKAIRFNQITKDKKKHQLVPFRESKLTRMFQSFLVGYGKASMVVNVSQAPYLFDETVQVLKFAAVTSKITVERIAASVETPPTVVPNRKRKTRFSMMVDDHHAAAAKRGVPMHSALMGRGSIAWERPAARSTMCPVREEETVEGSVLEETVAMEESAMDATFVDERYKGLNQLIDTLKDQLIKEKQKNITLEKEVRTELCNEFNDMLVEVEKDWEKRLQDERERTEELNEWRIGKVQEFYRAKRKRQKQEEEEEEQEERGMDKTAAFELEEKTTELECLQEKMTALEEEHNLLAKEKVRLQEDVLRVEKELERERKESEMTRADLEEVKKELEAKNTSEKSNSAEPVIEDLKRQVEEGKAKVAKLEEEKKALKELLDEAGEDFLEKKTELEAATRAAEEAEQERVRDKVVLAELRAQLEEARMLLQDSAARMEEKEAAAAELEEQLEALEKEREALKVGLEAGRLEAVRELDAVREKYEQAEKAAQAERERVERQLNDEIEELKAAKKKLKTQLENKAKSSEAADKDIAKLEGEVKSLIQAEKQQRQVAEEKTAEIAMLRKQLRDISAKEAEAKKGAEATIKDMDSQMEKLQIRLSSQAKEHRAIEVIQEELHSRVREKDELAAEVSRLKSQLEARDYDLGRMKEERDGMLGTYEQRLKRAMEELSMEKRESAKMREVMMLKSTPTKSDMPGSPNSSANRLARRGDRLVRENQMLRDELQKKTDVIKKLESMIPAKKELRYPSSGDEGDATNSEGDDSANLKGEVLRLQRELESERAARESEKTAHKKELKKIKRANEKETNRELQRKVSSTATSVSSAATSMVAATEESTLEADDSNNGSLIEETPGGRARKRARRVPGARGRARKAAHNKTDSASQASFEDTIENVEPEDEDDSMPPRRSTRLKRTQPVRKTRSGSISSQQDSSTANNSRSNELQVLQAIQESSPSVERASYPAGKTPSARKRQLYDADAVRSAQFTPPTAESIADGPAGATPRTVVKRQLRSRSSRKKRA